MLFRSSAFKLVDGPLLRSLPLEARGLNYSTEVTSRLIERGVVLAEADVDHQPRSAGKSSRTAIRGSLDRLAFVLFLGLRQMLRRLGVLRVEQIN